MHQTYRFKNQMFTYHTARLRKAIELSRDNLVVLDRLWMSEEVYGHVYRGGTKWPHEGRMMDRVLRKHAAINIICSSKPEIISARHAQMKLKRVEQFNDNMEKIAGRFNKLYYGDHNREVPAKTYVDHLQIAGGMVRRGDTLYYSIESEGRNPELFRNVVFDTLEDFRRKQYEPALDPGDHNILGHLGHAKYLFVGDEVNPKSRTLRWPFYDYGHSSLFLSECLHNLSFDETTAMWTNANNSPDHLEELVEIKPFKVIALGGRALQRLERLKIPVHAKVDHPQYAKRFIKDPLHAYSEQLLRALQ